MDWFAPTGQVSKKNWSTFGGGPLSLLVAVSGKLIVDNIRNVKRNLSVLFTTRQTSKRIC